MFIIDIENDPASIFGKTTPSELKKQLEDLALKTEPLGRGELKDLPFENGGGYRAHYHGNGYIQYHPARSSHHNGRAYYKTSDSKNGIRHFWTSGEEFDE